MGSCLEEMNNKKLKKGPWTSEEDEKLVKFISKHGYGNWRTLPRRAGLDRGGKSCRLRWANYLRPDIKRGNFSPEEEHTIIKLHQLHGNKWSRIATHLPRRTDNEIKNYWNTHIKKKFLQMGMDPKTHKPRTDLSHLLNLCHQLLYCLEHFSNVLLMTNPNSLRLHHQPSAGSGNNNDNDDNDNDDPDQTAHMLPTQLLQNQLLHNILTTTKSLAPNFPGPFLESHHQNPNVNISSEAVHDPLFSPADNVNGVLCEYSPNFNQVNLDNYGQSMSNNIPFGGPSENEIPVMQPPLEGFSDNQIMQANMTGVALFDGGWQNLMDDQDDETCCSYTGNMLWA